MRRNEFDRLRGKPPEKQAASWLQYDYYTFFVYPQVQPDDPKGEKVMQEKIERMCKRLSGLSVLDGLNLTRQRELAALVLDSLAEHEMFDSYRRGREWVREGRLLGEREVKKLKQAAQTLEAVAGKLYSGESRRLKKAIENGLAKRRPDLNQHPMTSKLKAIASDLRGLTVDVETKVDVGSYMAHMREHFPCTNNPTGDTTSQLFWFLVSKCGLARNEAQVRVAKIGNSILGQNITYRSKYAGSDLWKGSTTIRERIHRKLQGQHRSKLKSSPKPRKRPPTETLIQINQQAEPRD